MSTLLLVVTKWLLIETDWPGCRKGAQFATALGYYGLLCWADRTILAPLFGYQGLEYRSASTLTQLGVVGLILLCTALTPVRYRQPSDGVLYVLLPLVVIPVLTVAATDAHFEGLASNLIITIAGAYLLLALCSMLPRQPSGLAKRLSLRRPWAIAILLSVASYGLMFTTFGVHLKLLSFSDVYDVRAVYKEQASGATHYLLEWQANVINPLFVVYGIRFRRSLPLIAGVLGDFLIYTTTGSKSVLFSALAVVALLFALRQKNSAVRPPVTGVRIGFAFAALVAIAGVIDTFNHTAAWTSLLVRRLSLVAGVNTGYYFQYFSIEPKTHLAYGFVGMISGATGAVPPPQQIAAFAYHTLTINPDANLWADAYANFGYIGVVLFTLILAGFLWLYDRLARNADKRAATVLLVAPALSLANSALLTCLLTHGMLLALLAITQWPSIVRQVEGPDDLNVGRSHTGRPALRRRPPRRSRRLDQGGVRKAGFIVLVGSGLGFGISILLTPFIAHIFEPAVYGSFALITAVTSVFVGVSTFRLEFQAQKNSDDTEASELIRLAFVASCAWGVILTLAAYVAVGLWHLSRFWLSTGLLVFLASLQLVGSAVLTRARRYRSLAIANFLQAASLSIVQVSLGLLSAGVGSLIAGFGAARLGWFLALRQPRREMPGMATLWKGNRRFAAVAGSSAFINSLTGQLPVLLIAIFYGDATVGQLAIAIRILVAPLSIVGSAAASANIGEVGNLIRRGNENAAQLVKRGMRDLLVVGLIPCGIATALGVWLVPLILGKRWDEAGQLLAVLTAGTLAQFVAAPFTALLIMTGNNPTLLKWDIARFCATVLSLAIPWALGLSAVSAIGCYSIAFVVVYTILARLTIRAVAAYPRYAAALQHEPA